MPHDFLYTGDFSTIIQHMGCKSVADWGLASDGRSEGGHGYHVPLMWVGGSSVGDGDPTHGLTSAAAKGVRERIRQTNVGHEGLAVSGEATWRLSCLVCAAAKAMTTTWLCLQTIVRKEGGRRCRERTGRRL